jgi:hypothetical protein
MISAQESGIGGFLLLFAIVLVLNIIVALFNTPRAYLVMTSPDLAALGRIYPAYPFVVTAEFVFALVRFAGLVIGLVLLVRRDRRAPAFFVGFFGAVIVFTMADMYVGSRFTDAAHVYLTQHGQSTAGVDQAHRVARYQGIGSLMWAAAWLLYWRSSERVRLTFTPGSGMTEIPTQS